MKQFNKHSLHQLALSCFLFWGVFHVTSLEALGNHLDGKQLAEKSYVDPKGFFEIFPPQGWTIQEFPKDPRGKTVFLGTEPGVDVRVLVEGTELHTLDELERNLKAIESSLGVNTHIERVFLNGQPGIKRSFLIQGSRILSISFLKGNVAHNLQYTAPILSFADFFELVQASWRTYEPILKNVGDSLRQKHATAKSIRLGEVFLEMHQPRVALEYIQDGLRSEPQDTRLLELFQKAQKELQDPM